MYQGGDIDAGDWLIGVVADGFGLELPGVAGIVAVTNVVFGFFGKKESRLPCFRLPLFLLCTSRWTPLNLYMVMGSGTDEDGKRRKDAKDDKTK